jgi:hypothetical protein
MLEVAKDLDFSVESRFADSCRELRSEDLYGHRMISDGIVSENYISRPTLSDYAPEYVPARQRRRETFRVRRGSALRSMMRAPGWPVKLLIDQWTLSIRSYWFATIYLLSRSC